MIIVGERESKLAVEHFDEEKEEILNGIYSDLKRNRGNYIPKDVIKEETCFNYIQRLCEGQIKASDSGVETNKMSIICTF